LFDIERPIYRRRKLLINSQQQTRHENSHDASPNVRMKEPPRRVDIGKTEGLNEYCPDSNSALKEKLNGSNDETDLIVN
jgi:ribosomal protein L14E/L6E/L27E